MGTLLNNRTEAYSYDMYTTDTHTTISSTPYSSKKTESVRNLVIYDINSCPAGITIQDVMDQFKESGFLFYDSQGSEGQGAKEPRIIKIKEEGYIFEVV